MRPVASRGLAAWLRALPLGLVLLAAPAALAASIDDYHTRVERAMSDVDAVYYDTSSEPEAAVVARVRAALPPHETVETGEGASVEVDNSWLGAELDAFTATKDVEARYVVLERVSTRLAEIDAHLEALAAAHAPNGTPADRERLQKVLERPEFRDRAEDPIAKYVRELRTTIARWLESLLRKLFGGARGTAFDSGLRIVIVAFALVAIALLVRAVVIAAARRRAADVRGKKTVLGEEIDETTTAESLATAARALADAGDFRGATRKLFVALLYQLDERGLVRLQSATTNREYLRLVRDLRPLYPVMATMTDTFEHVWYGQRPTDRAVFDAFDRQYAEASRIVAQSAPAAAGA